MIEAVDRFDENQVRLRMYAIAIGTIALKELNRFMRIWVQTILPPAIAMGLYFIEFGSLIGPRIGEMGGFTYLQYIAPGIIMMAIITNSYSNVVTSFFGAKFQRHIEEILVAPVPNILIVMGWVCGGMIVGALVTVVALFFTELKVNSWPITVAIVVLISALFALGGLINAIFAKNFDDISIVPTFVLTLLTYLGGVLYSIELLPDVWRQVSLFNPILYMVNVSRYGILGVSDIDLLHAFTIIIAFIIALGTLAVQLLRRGVGVRT